MEAERREQLLEKCHHGKLSNDDRDELFAWLQHPDNEHEAKVFLLQLIEQNNGTASINDEDAEHILTAILNIDKEFSVKEKGRLGRIGSRIRRAAAVIVILLGLTWFWTHKNQSTQNKTTLAVFPTDISAPQSNRAAITLADGRQVFLDSVNNGALAQVGNIRLIKLANGQVAYQSADGQILKELQYNTLTNPRGSKIIDIQLSDGSHVWLNAGSSITYPVAFIDNERKVILKGEGYFEVAKNPLKKFIVVANGSETEVLGTHFNIRAYDDESGPKITLLEGSVSVKTRSSTLKIKPGEQALVTASGLDRSKANIDQVMAWKEGYFNFDEMNLKETLREIERWYEIKIIYGGKEQVMSFGGNINRNISLNDALLILKKSGLRFSWDPAKRELSVF